MQHVNRLIKSIALKEKNISKKNLQIAKVMPKPPIML